MLRDASPLGDGAFGETGTFSSLSKGSLPERAGEEQSDETEGVSKQKGLILSELYDILTETPPTKVVLLALDQGLWDCERSLAELAALCCLLCTRKGKWNF